MKSLNPSTLPSRSVYLSVLAIDTTLKNIEKNGRIAIAAVSGAESYQVKGKAEFVTEGPMFDFFEKLTVDTFGGALHAKCAIAVTPEKLIVASPNADNRKELEL